MGGCEIRLKNTVRIFTITCKSLLNNNFIIKYLHAFTHCIAVGQTWNSDSS